MRDTVRPVAALVTLSAGAAVAWAALGIWASVRVDAVYRYWNRLDEFGSAGTDEVEYQRRVSDFDAASLLAQSTPWLAFLAGACLVVLLAALAVSRADRPRDPAEPAR
ncbi:MAG: hypothetical protein J0G30_02585 [Actinomycetales bacterium]|nr:hypothetical protein [Actinomycetales bacterium]